MEFCSSFGWTEESKNPSIDSGCSQCKKAFPTDTQLCASFLLSWGLLQWWIVLSRKQCQDHSGFHYPDFHLSLAHVRKEWSQLEIKAKKETLRRFHHMLRWNWKHVAIFGTKVMKFGNTKTIKNKTEIGIWVVGPNCKDETKQDKEKEDGETRQLRKYDAWCRISWLRMELLGKIHLFFCSLEAGSGRKVSAGSLLGWR